MLFAVEDPKKPSEVSRDQPFRIQLIGEAAPILDEKFAQISSDPALGDDVPIYEYLWTLAQVECPSSNDTGSAQSPLVVRDVEVRLDFAKMSGWRISEPIGTVKFMSPAPKAKGGFLKRTQIPLEVASRAAGLIPGGASASKWMEAASQLEATSLPQVGNVEWAISSSAVKHEDEFRQRITWTFPKDMFKTLGGMLSGGLAVAFLGAEANPPLTKPIEGEIYISAQVHVENGRRLVVAKKVEPRQIPDSKPLPFPLRFVDTVRSAKSTAQFKYW